MNMTTHTKAMLEIIVTDMDANGSLIENRMLELQTGDLVRMLVALSKLRNLVNRLTSFC